MDDQQSPEAMTPEEEEKLRRIEEDLARVADNVHFQETDEDGREQKLREIEEQARVSRARFEKHTPAGTEGSFVNQETGRSLGRGLQIAYAIIGLPLVGFGVGWLVDSRLGGNLWQGLGTILGAGIAVTYAVKAASRP